MYDEVQRFSRTKMVLPLRVWLNDQGYEATATLWAHTIDTSDIGCRLGGLRTSLSPGQIITLQRGQHKAPFRVIWTRQLEPHENQAGVEAIDYSVNIWAFNTQPDAPATETKKPTPSAATALAASSRPASTASSKSVSTAASKPVRKFIFAGARRHLRWLVAACVVAAGMGMGVYQYLRIFPDSRLAAIEPRVPTPPTAEDLARLTPKPHLMPTWLTKPLEASGPRVEVAEAPTGRVVYPIAPDDFITGKVRLQIIVAANGLVKQIHVLSGKQPLAEAAARAVHMWHYASLAGNAPFSERQTSVTVSFRGADAVSLEFPRAQSIAASSKDD